MKNKNKWAFSIVLAMILVIIMLLVAYNLLDMLIPFSKNTKGIENASNAYYQSYWAVEQSINFIAKNPIWSSTWTSMPWNVIWSSITMISTWTVIPEAWKWNSEFDKNWNRIAPGEPVQLYVKNLIDWNTNTKLYFRVPDLNLDKVFNDETLSWGTLPIINWQISWSWYTLNSSWSQILASEINKSNRHSTTTYVCGYHSCGLHHYCQTYCTATIDSVPSILWWKDWIDLNWSWLIFSTAYSDSDKLNSCSWSWCSLKLSIINELKTTAWTPLPYLEYKIEFKDSSNNWVPVPEQYVDITTEWKSYWFKKTINTKYRVDTTSEAFDFTVFQ